MPIDMEVFVETRAYKAFRYKAKTTWSTARRGFLSAADKPKIVVGSPPEFKGEPENAIAQYDTVETERHELRQGP